LQLQRRQALGIGVMVGISLLQPVAEFLTTADRARLFARLVALIVGLPLVIVWASAVFRWAARRRVGTVPLMLAGAGASGVLFAILLSAAHRAGYSIEALRPYTGGWRDVDAARVGFAMGLTSFALWALVFVFPFAAEDAGVRALESEKLRIEAELAQFRAHLAPHFLLNTLNAVAGLVTVDPRQARRLLASLGDLLRDSLRSEGEMQTLEEQLKWLRRYAQILEVRHTGQLAFRWEVPDETRRAVLPRLLLQPLVENAIQHGALKRQGGGEITIRTRLDGEKLVCIIEDNGPGMPDGATRPGAFGLASVRRRLALRYAGAASLRLESSSSGLRSIVELPHEQ
jgi:signal transduction histidine kinase